MTEVIELDDALTCCDSEDASDSMDTTTSASNNNDCSLSIQLRSQFELIRSIHEACGNGNAPSEERDKPFVEEVSVLSSSWDSDFEEFESPPKCSSEQDLRQLKLSLAISTALKVESEIASLSAGISELESLFFQQDQEHVQDKIDGRGYGNVYQNDIVMCDKMKRSENEAEEQTSICTPHITKQP
jgi:hypothetical protein